MSWFLSRNDVRYIVIFGPERINFKIFLLAKISDLRLRPGELFLTNFNKFYWTMKTIEEKKFRFYISHWSMRKNRSPTRTLRNRLERIRNSNLFVRGWKSSRQDQVQDPVLFVIRSEPDVRWGYKVCSI